MTDTFTDSEPTTEAAPTKATSVRLGQGVTYFDSNGRQKAAIVIGTHESTQSGSVESPEPGNVHLTIYNPSGRRYTRTNVPEAMGENPTSAFTA